MEWHRDRKRQRNIHTKKVYIIIMYDKYLPNESNVATVNQYKNDRFHYSIRMIFFFILHFSYWFRAIFCSLINYFVFFLFSFFFFSFLIVFSDPFQFENFIGFYVFQYTTCVYCMWKSSLLINFEFKLICRWLWKRAYNQ